MSTVIDRRTLERAVKLDKDDPFVHLYLGIAMLKTDERECGRKEIEKGLERSTTPERKH
jgi:hypothetical protein